MEPPGTAVRTAVSPARARPSGPKLSALSTRSYGFSYGRGVLCQVRVRAWAFDLAAGLPHPDDVGGIGQDGDVGQRVAVHDDEVGVIALGELAAAGGLATKGERAVEGGGLDRLQRRQARVDQQGQLAAVATPRIDQLRAAEGDVGAHGDGHPLLVGQRYRLSVPVTDHLKL